MTTLTVEKRTKTDTVGALERKGRIPAVFYGPKEKSTPISISLVDFKKAWRKAGESTIIILKGDGVDEVEALIQDLDLHPVTDVPRHVDFYAVEKGKKVKVGVPIEFVGVAPAIKDLGGTLVKVLHELEIEALPKDLPHGVKVDISSLATMQSNITAGSIALSAGVVLITKADEIVASIAEPMKEIEEAAPVDLSAIEVEKKGKTDEAGAEAPAADGKAPAKDAKAPAKDAAKSAK